MGDSMEKKQNNNSNTFYCSNCGSKLIEGQDVCLKCGVFVNKRKNKSRVNKERANFSLMEVIIIILITTVLVGTLTGLIVYKNYDKFDKSSTNNYSGDLKEIEDAYNQILDKYYNKVDKAGLINSAIEGMYNFLGDPYSTYLNEADTKELKERLDGEFFGLGIEFTQNDNGHEIMNVFEGGPADKAGLQKGDIIIKLNNEDVSSLSSGDIASRIKYSNISEITITVKRQGKEITKDIKLSKVTIPSVTSELIDNAGYIKINTFASNTYDQVNSALKKLEDNNINGLVIDLRGNGGGLLHSASDIASLFLSKGEKIYGLQNGAVKKFFTDSTKDKRLYKIAVLIDGASASASEILAAALKESYGAVLVGTKSYGKGTVQETSDLSSGAMVKFTTGYWLTPKGNNINGVGLTPDIEEADEVKALNKAIEAIK